MRNDKVNKILISAIQALCVFCVYMWVESFFTENKVSPWLYYFSPLFASLLLSFVLSIFLEMQITQKSVARIAIPAALMYLILYAFEPLVFRFQPDFFLGICGFLLPFTLAGFFMNCLAIWLGSLVRRKVFKGKSSSSANS